MRPPARAREAFVVVDLGFGDAGKGAAVDFLCRDRAADLVVRWHGGAQAGHAVSDGTRTHVCAQLGAGALAGVPALLGPAFLLHPLALALEAEHLARSGVPDPLAGVALHEDAPVITPWQQAAGRARERLRGARAHGTCGVGVGERVADGLLHPEDAVRAAELRDRAALRRKLAAQRERKRAELRALGAGDLPELATFEDDALGERAVAAWAALPLAVLPDAAFRARLAAADRVVFEGAQGVLLDERWGFHPHTTWSDCTPAVARGLAADRPTTVLGCLRAYGVRHGPGPFPAETGRGPAEPHNADDGWQGRFRRGAVDGVLLRYALAVAGPIDALALSWLDAVPEGDVVDRWPGPAPAGLAREDASGVVDLVPGAPDDLAHRARLAAWAAGVRATPARAPIRAFLEAAGGVPVALEGRGPTAADRRWVRAPGTSRGPTAPPSGPRIRPERPEDVDAVRGVLGRAFGRPDEAAIVDRLRAGGDLACARVVEVAGRVVGHVAFSPVRCGDAVGEGLGPLAVDPDHAAVGLGALLVAAGLRDLVARGVPFAVVLGDPRYYARFGFRPCAPGLRWEGGHDGAFQALALAGALPSGVVRYAPAFGPVPTEAG